MPSKYQRKSISAEQDRMTAAELARQHSLTVLVRRYEVLRLTRGSERDEAERELGAALTRCEGPFSLDGWIWSWSRGEQSILRHKATGMYQMPKHKQQEQSP